MLYQVRDYQTVVFLVAGKPVKLVFGHVVCHSIKMFLEFWFHQFILKIYFYKLKCILLQTVRQFKIVKIIYSYLNRIRVAIMIMIEISLPSMDKPRKCVRHRSFISIPCVIFSHHIQLRKLETVWHALSFNPVWTTHIRCRLACRRQTSTNYNLYKTRSFTLAKKRAHLTYPHWLPVWWTETP